MFERSTAMKKRKETREMPDWPRSPRRGAIGSMEMRSVSGFTLSGPLPGLLPQSYRPLETSSSSSSSTQRQPPVAASAIQGSDVAEVNCLGQPEICGEAACQQKNDYVARCICPHDRSPPTADFKCPHRIIVPLTPRPIPNIIPPNMNMTNSTMLNPESEQIEAVETRLPEVTGLVIGCAFVLTLLIGLILYYFRRRNFDTKSTSGDLEASPMSLKESLLLANKYAPNPQYFTCNSPDVPVLQRNSLVFLKDIGEGCFGKVFKGELIRDDKIEVVAIKVLKSSANKEAEEDFMREVETMSTFRHENILSLLGVVLRDDTNGPWMIFEYMPYGDLAEVLRASAPNVRTHIAGLQPLTKDSLLWITTQIASGMEYLAAQRFVHRDLACRNCLVGDELVVKIADFGMSRDVYTCDYYRIGGSRMLPIRWMAPESVVYGRFTLESDIYSFGVLLWEVFTFGKQPYFGHSNEESVQLIMDGIQLVPPDDCPGYICQLMRDCWREARDRPTFSEILERLQMADKLDINNPRIGTLPRPPQGPVTIRTPDALDSDGYLLPTPVATREYIEAVAV